MNIIANERPGIFYDYDTSSIIYSEPNNAVVGIVAEGPNNNIGEIYNIYKISDAETIFGNNQSITELCKIAIENGAYKIAAINIGDNEENYAQAFNKLKDTENICVIICDSHNIETQTLLMQSVVSASENCKERIGIVAAPQDSNVSTWASNFNCERIILVAQNPIDNDGNIKTGNILAAALAALVSKNYDNPSKTFNGAVISSISSLSPYLTDSQIDDYILSGVTPFEKIADRIEVIRAITSKKELDSSGVNKVENINLILISDFIIRNIREALYTSLSFSSNYLVSYSSIENQVIIKLQEYLELGLISSYEKPNIYQSTNDQSVCIVELDFVVINGVNQIHLTANIKV